jgi:pimeloyl-ACP methyl ester carboxylesterase
VADDADFAISNTLSFSTPTYDPVADAQVMSLDLGTRYESQHIEGGYSTDGSTLINEWNYGDQDFVGSAASVHINNDNATVYDAYGNVVPNYDDAALSSYTGSTINTIDANSGACPESHPECNPPMDMSISVGSGAGAMTYSARPSLQYQGENVLVTIPISDPEGSASSKGPHGELRKLYTKRHGQWVLITEDETTQETFGTITLNTSLHVEHKNYSFHDNPAMDAERAAWRKTHKNVATASMATPTRTSSALMPAIQRITVPPSPRRDIVENGGPGQGVVMQHGVASSEATWSMMKPWLTGPSSPFVITKVLVPSLQWQYGVATQAADLESRASWVGPDAVFIGHSMGGLVSRRVGQDNASYPGSLVKGVISIDSPHQGATIAKSLRYLVDYQRLNSDLRSISFLKACNHGWAWICAWSTYAQSGAVDEMNTQFDASYESSNDLLPGSSALQNLNARNEPFLRAGITNNVQGRFKWARLVGDFTEGPSEVGLGRSLQSKISSVFLNLRHCSHMWWLGPAAGFCKLIYLHVLLFDETFQHYIDPQNSGSDGVVTDPSQTYPNTPTSSGQGAPLNFTIADGESHVGALKSTVVRDIILQRAFPAFNVPAR